MRKLSYILVAGGIFLVFIPTMNHWYSSYAQNQLLEEWAGNHPENAEIAFETDVISIEFSIESEIDSDVVLDNDSIMLESYTMLDDIFSEQDESQSSSETSKTSKTYEQDAAIGLITIDKINKTLPILEGATSDNMKKAAVHLTGTTAFGEIGNSVIAAHRGYKYDRLFNRLDELELEDIIIIETEEETYEYEVFRISIVEPSDLSVLKRNDKDRVLTLITCTPLNVATHRLIIHAVIRS